MLSKPEEDTITIISQELKPLTISIKAARGAKTIDSFINDFPTDKMNINIIKYSILEKIKIYLEHYENEKPKEILYPLPNKDFSSCVDDWDYKFIDIDNTDTIFELMNAANFLDINSLLNLTCAKIASLIKGKNPNQLKDLFNLKKSDNQDIIECNRI